jgi:hypothetical protein
MVWNCVQEDVLVTPLAITQELKGWPMVVHLPDQVRQSYEDHENDSGCRPSRTKHPALLSDQQSQCDRYEKKRHGGLVQQTHSSRDAEDDPPERLRALAQ